MATVIHVGWPKTGSTALQRGFFPRVPDSAFLQPTPPTSRFREVASYVRSADDDAYDGDVLRSFLEESGAGVSTLLMSLETLSTGSDPIRTAHRLRDASPDARIFVCVRSQRTLMDSMYSQYIRNGGFKSFPAWLEVGKPERHRYDALVEAYQRAFGPERVLVLAYEQLVTAEQEFLARLADFVSPGAPLELPTEPMSRANVSLSAPSRWITRKSNRWFRKSNSNPKPPLPSPRASRAVNRVLAVAEPVLFRRMSRGPSAAQRRLTDEWCQCYAESNDRLRALTGLPLAELGYPLPTT
jgi:hypothetical protein